jgi:ribose 5-phosphate isomerase B
MSSRRLALGSDHAGLTLRAVIAEHLRALGHEVVDTGPFDASSVDYPDRAREVTALVLDGSVERGILICGTGQGMAMAANKVPGIRAAVVADAFSARMAMAHNDARVLCLGERVLGAGVALDCVDAWLQTDFEGGRHARRVGKMEGTG